MRIKICRFLTALLIGSLLTVSLSAKSQPTERVDCPTGQSQAECLKFFDLVERFSKTFKPWVAYHGATLEIRANWDVGYASQFREAKIWGFKIGRSWLKSKDMT